MVDMCKPSLSWTLSATASRLCQIAGWNRLSALAHDSKIERNEKVALFWCAYGLDRNASLRLGRAPCIQDFDIDVPRPQPLDQFDEASLFLLNFWIDVAKVQGQVCSSLFSPGALRQPQDTRTRLAETLAIELNKIWTAREEVSLKRRNVSHHCTDHRRTTMSQRRCSPPKIKLHCFAMLIFA